MPKLMQKQTLTLKADLHLHTKDDPKDYDEVSYDSFQLVDNLEKKGFDVFAITLHEGMLDDRMMQKIRKYAKNKGMISIPGIEQKIEGRHILLLNMKKIDAEKIKRYDDLKHALMRPKNRHVLVVAAHPYYPFFTAARGKVAEWQESIDCLEYNSFYTRYTNFFNKKAYAMARKLKKVLIGNTDAHFLEQIGHTYTEIYLSQVYPKKISSDKESFKRFVKRCSDKEYDTIIKDIIESIREGDVKLKTTPLTTGYVIKSLIRFIINDAQIREDKR